MKVLYRARMSRYDLIRPVQALASRVTKWNHLCDRKLHRLISYVNSMIFICTVGWAIAQSSLRSLTVMRTWLGVVLIPRARQCLFAL